MSRRMIRSFKHKRLDELYNKGRRSFGVQNERLIHLMDLIDGIEEIRDLVGVAHFHALTGRGPGWYAMHVTRNWRFTFRIEDGDAFDLDYEDYH